MRHLLILGIGLLCAACGSSGTTSNEGNSPSTISPNTVADSGNSNTSPTTTADTPTTYSNDLISPGPEPTAMQGMLQRHNEVRASVAVMPLIWSTRMQAYAEEWAKHLANNNACKMQHRSAANNDPLNAGENLYWAGPLRWSDGRTEQQQVKPQDVVQLWADERADYNYSTNSCAPGKVCGHYTQVVWRNTTEVGCGMAVCPDKGQIWVCNYNPPGNWVGQLPY